MNVRMISGVNYFSATGMVVGAAVTMMADPISDKQRRKFVKKTEGVFRNLGGIIDNAMDMIH